MLDGTQFVGTAISVGVNRVSLKVTEPDDAFVARGMFERFARKHGASDYRIETLAALGAELSSELVTGSHGGLIEIERVGSFIEVRALGGRELAHDVPRNELPSPPTTPPASPPEPSWRLDLALGQMDGAERTGASSSRIVYRAWCGLD